jgi:hypothetical protein
VALPALIEALQAFIDLLDGQPEPLPPLAWIPELEKARAALAQADGPAPTEEK